MESIANIQGYFAEIQTTKEHNGYYYSMGETLAVVIHGSLCGLRNVRQMNLRRASPAVSFNLHACFRNSSGCFTSCSLLDLVLAS